jgi:hypothetical protein
MANPNVIGVNKRISTQGSIGHSPVGSKSTAVTSLADGDWWTEEEARLYESWAGASERYTENQINPYFDYFFSGQDIAVKIDGLDDNDFLPIYSIGYVVQQEKTPLYGFASYTYDAMLRGTRIVSGMFSIVVTEPFLLTTKIAESANRRARTNQSLPAGTFALRHLDGDVANVNRYWSKTRDSVLGMDDKHIFSIHPPFNLLIKYGIQDVGLYSQLPDQARSNEIRNDFANNGPMWTDTNERLYDTKSGSGVPNGGKILLENIELTSKSVEYDPSGDPILETYSFLARDERIVDEPYTMNKPNALPVNTGNNATGEGRVRMPGGSGVNRAI